MQLHLFNIGDIPVRVSLWYGLLLMYWFQGGSDPGSTLLWVIVATVSILVHEMGHALVARHYRLRPGILLHGLGGLCHHDRAERDRHDVLIIAAGPGAGLLLGALTWLLSMVAPFELQGNAWFEEAIAMSLYVNIGWSFVNLLPIWPLDGGQLFRLLMLRFLKPTVAEKATHYTALALLLVAFGIGARTGSGFLMMLVFWTAWSNLMALRGDNDSGPIRPVSKAAQQLLTEAREAYARQDFKEAARLGQLLRREGNVSESIAREGRLVLGLACARIGEHTDALKYLRNEKATAEVVEARIECLFALGEEKDLSSLLNSEDFSLITRERRDEILAIVRPRD